MHVSNLLLHVQPEVSCKGLQSEGSIEGVHSNSLQCVWVQSIGQTSLVHRHNLRREREFLKHHIPRPSYLSPPEEDIGVGGITVLQLRPSKSEEILHQDGCVLEGGVWVGAHLPSVEVLLLLLLLLALLRGNETASQVDTPTHKGQGNNHPITINSCRECVN